MSSTPAYEYHGLMYREQTHIQSPATRSYSQEQALILFQRAGFKDIQMFSEFSSNRPNRATPCSPSWE